MSRLYHARRRLQEMLPDLAPREAVSENTEGQSSVRTGGP